jgi:hypothetical protein
LTQGEGHVVGSSFELDGGALDQGICGKGDLYEGMVRSADEDVTGVQLDLDGGFSFLIERDLKVLRQVD